LMEIDGMLRGNKEYLPADTPMPVSLSLLQPLLCHEAALSITRFPHILLVTFQTIVDFFALSWKKRDR